MKTECYNADKKCKHDPKCEHACAMQLTTVNAADYAISMFNGWRESRIKFMADHPATSMALGLTKPPAELEHTSSADCWCQPKIDYTDPETGVSVYVHNRPN